MQAKTLLSLALLTLLAALIAACGAAATPTPVPTATAPPPTPTATPMPEPLVLGTLRLDFFDHRFNGSELHSHEGPVVRSVQLAVDHVNAAGGVLGQPVEIHFPGIEENLTLPELFRLDILVEALSLLEDEGAHAIIGPTYSVHFAQVAEEVAKPRRIPVLSQSTAPSVAEREDDGYTFRVSFSDLAQAQALAALAENEGFDHVALVHQDTLWGNDLAENFKAHYNGRVTEIALHPESENFAEELHQISASGAPCLVLLTFHQQAELVMQEVEEHGHFEEFLMTADLRSLPFLEQWPDLLDGSKGVAPIGKHVTEAEGHWEADYLEHYGEEPHGTYMRESYDAAMAVMVAAEFAGSTDGTDIRDALQIIGNPPGERFPASAEGVKGALAAVRQGMDIDLEGEATSLNWDDRGEIVVGHMSVWEYKDGEILDLRHFDVDLTY